MYYTLGIDSNVESVFLLSKPYLEKISEPQLVDIKQAYLNFLNTKQSYVWHPSAKDNQFLFDKKIIQGLIEEHREQDHLTDLTSDVTLADSASMHAALAAIKAAIDCIKEFEPELFDLFNLVINTLYYARSNLQGGGSVSSAIGVIWCANRRSWNIQDIVEFLVHELTHNLLFIDELRYQHYYNFEQLENKTNYASSAILNIPRPLDKAFHSLVVAIEIVALRTFWLGDGHKMHVHPSNDVILNSCCTTINSIKSLPNLSELVTKRFMTLLEYMECCVENVERVAA